MTDSEVRSRRLPRLPYFRWAAFAGERRTNLDCVLDVPNRAYTESGRAAISLALRNLGVGAGDRVLVPTYHCPTMIAPVVESGAQPLFFAIDSNGAPVIDALSAVDLTGVRAMIAVHYFGFPQPMARLRQFCDDRRISLIEDCAHAMFGRTDERPIGTSGDYAIASLTKFFPVADGGCLVSSVRPIDARWLRSPSFGEQVKAAANAIENGAEYRGMPSLNHVVRLAFAAGNAVHRWRRASSAPERASSTPSPDTARAPSDTGTMKRASAWSEWIARTARRGRIVDARRRNYRHLAARLADLPGTRVLRPELPESVAPYVFPLWVAAPQACYPRIRAAGIPVFRWDDVWPGVPPLPGDFGPDWSIRVLQLACHQDLRVSDLDFMSDSVIRIVGGGRA